MAKPSRNRKDIPKAQSEKLWGASAGRCNICNTSLLRDETTGVEVKAGEKAHIVGVSDGPRSPRGQDPLPKSQRDRAENLILLCEKHHTEVDSRPDLYSADYLRDLKRKFEERIFYLTSLQKEQETLVYRLLGDIHGGKTPDLTAEQVRETVRHEEGRYPRYALSSTPDDVSVDLRELTTEGSEEYWAEARRRIDERARHLDDLRGQGKAGHVSVFGLARIPVLVMLGDSLGDASEISIYHRRNDGGWGWDPDVELPEFELIEHRIEPSSNDVTLMCSFSAPVQIERGPDEIEGTNLYEMRPKDRDPGNKLFDHPQAKAAFAQAYRLSFEGRASPSSSRGDPPTAGYSCGCRDHHRSNQDSRC